MRRAGPPAGRDRRGEEEERRTRLSERQAKAILEMRLSRLTGLEHEKLAKEYGELCDAIARYRAILASPKLLDDVIVMELEEIRTKYADKRRTEIVDERRRDPGRGPHPGRGHGRHHLPRRLHQAHEPEGLPGAEARRQGPHRDGGARRGLGDPALRRVDARVRLLLQRQGQGLRQEGLRDPAGGAHEQGPRDRELHRHGAGREDRGHRRGARRSRRASSSSRSRRTGRSRRPSSTSTRTSARRASSA